VQSVEVKGLPAAREVMVRTRNTVPEYTLHGYTLRAVAYAFGDIPVDRFESALPNLAPGQTAAVAISFHEKAPARVQFDILRPTPLSWSIRQCTKHPPN
jgi:hypothetical protein